MKRSGARHAARARHERDHRCLAALSSSQAPRLRRRPHADTGVIDTDSEKWADDLEPVQALVSEFARGAL
jgi:hypothetical protein